MIAVSCTQWDADTEIVWLQRSADIVGSHIHTLQVHSLKCVFSECTNSRRTLDLSGKRLTRGLLCLLSPSPSATDACMCTRIQARTPRETPTQVGSVRVQSTDYTQGAQQESGGGGGGLLEKREETVREQRRVLLPSTRTPSALYDNVRVQERQS